jgi:hypothetical protein
MTTEPIHLIAARPVRAGEPVRIRAHHRAVSKLGQWTSARHVDIAASRGSVVLDFLTSRIEPGDIDVHLDLDHAVVKLLVPDGTRIDDDDLRRVGRGRVKDRTGEATTDGRLIKLRGELRNAEIRVHRGGIAILSMLLSRRSLGIVRQAHREGRLEVRHNSRPAPAR